MRFPWVAAVAVALAAVDSANISASAPGRPAHPTVFARSFRANAFLRGNLHVHTRLSDGDAAPEVVIQWYRDHGYAFLALTDHNRLSDPSAYASLVRPGFVLLGGEEVTMSAAGHQVHVNALCATTEIEGGPFAANGEALGNAISRISGQKGVALVNHPNFDWALGREDLPAMGRADLLEIASGHPYVHSSGDASHPSHEALWDAALTAGANVMAVGVDDAHHFILSAEPPAFPGKAWVEVFGASLDAESICSALRSGSLYASTGAALRSIRVAGDRYAVEPADRDAQVVFIVGGGRERQRTPALGRTVEYRLRGDERYVRARVELPNGARAWTPAVPTYVQ